MSSQKLNKAFCTCSKCYQKDNVKGIGILIPKSIRTRHRKKEYEKSQILDFSLSSSSSLEQLQL